VHRILVTPTFPMRAPSPCRVSLYLSSSAVHIFTNSHPACYPILPSIILAACHTHFPLFSISSSIRTPLPLRLSPLQFRRNALPFIFSHVLCFPSPLIPSVLDSQFWSSMYTDFAAIILLNVGPFPNDFLSSSTFRR